MSDDPNSTSKIKVKDLMKKSFKISEKIRKEGNKLYGQKTHTKELHKSILWTYSKSIAYAPVNSEELAAAYSNRSVILMHLGRYKESIADIDKAQEIAKSEGLLLKLVARKAKIVNSEKISINSLNLNDNEDKQNNDKSSSIPSLSIAKPSKIMPCASESVLLKYNKTFGRHFIAARDIKPGEVIVVEDGYTCIPKNNLRYLLCSNCLQFTWNGIPCDSCPFDIYCSEECKKEAWQDYHDIECSVYPYLEFLRSNKNGCVMADIAVALRIFLKAVKKEGLDTVLNEAELDSKEGNEIKGLLSNGILQTDKFRACYNLSSDAQHNEVTNRLGILTTKQMIDLLLTRTTIFDEKRTAEKTIPLIVVAQFATILNKIRLIVHVNSFSYQGSVCNCNNLDTTECACGSNRGIIIAPCSSLINHSCCSNLSRIFIPKKKVVFFAMTCIKKGDQLCDSYGPSIRTEKEIRQKALQDNFFFKCMCRACTENWPPQSKLELLINMSTESKIIYQVIYEFQKVYPKESELSMFRDPADVWGINEEGLKKAKLMCQLIHKYCDNYMKAFILSNPYRFYIDDVIFDLHGEKCVIPDVCIT